MPAGGWPVRLLHRSASRCTGGWACMATKGEERRLSQNRSPIPIEKASLMVAWPQWLGTTTMSPGPCTHRNGMPAPLGRSRGACLSRQTVEAAPEMPAYRGGGGATAVAPRKELVRPSGNPRALQHGHRRHLRLVSESGRQLLPQAAGCVDVGRTLARLADADGQRAALVVARGVGVEVEVRELAAKALPGQRRVGGPAARGLDLLSVLHQAHAARQSATVGERHRAADEDRPALGEIVPHVFVGRKRRVALVDVACGPGLLRWLPSHVPPAALGTGCMPSGRGRRRRIAPGRRSRQVPEPCVAEERRDQGRARKARKLRGELLLILSRSTGEGVHHHD
eukprot:scaffold1516_cov125-Isochrysis_galbana.AAC.2